MAERLNPAERVVPTPTLPVGGDRRATLHRSAHTRWQQNSTVYFPNASDEPVVTWHVPQSSVRPLSIFRRWL